MAERQHIDVDFEYDVTDPMVIGKKIAEIRTIQPWAHRFRISGWQPHEDRPGGYFRISYEDRAA